MSESTIKKDNSVVNNVYGNYIQSCLQRGQYPEPIPHTTMNEKHDILDGVVPSTSKLPALSYLIIGNGAHRYRTADSVVDGSVPTTPWLSYPELFPHDRTDAGLYNQVPFVIRPVHNDLTPAEQERMCLRKLNKRDGVDVIEYWGLRIPKGTEVTIIEETVVNGEKKTTPYITSTANLNPVVKDIPANSVIKSTSTKVKTSALTVIDFDAWLSNEFLNVCNILYNSPQYSVISEIGLCYGVDYPTSIITSSGTGITFNEVVGMTAAVFVSRHYYIQNSDSEGFTITIDTGISEPLLTSSNLSPTVAP